jgi:hypothetical protein
MLNDNIVLGGFGESVEIDETHLFRRKYHRGDILHLKIYGFFVLFIEEQKMSLLNELKIVPL